MLHHRLRLPKLSTQAAFVLVCAALLVLTLYVPHARSQGAGAALGGWAWSDTIGWVALHCSSVTANCTTWGLMNSGGSIQGYAWNDAVGWLRPAQASDGCPGTGMSVTGTNITGWLKALAGGGGWDGCISLSGTSPTYGVVSTANANPTYNPATSGAWGSDYAGWFGFNVTSGACSDTNWSCTGTLASRSNGSTCTTVTQECAPYTCVSGTAPLANPCTTPQGAGGCSLSIGALSPCAAQKRIAPNTATTLWWSVTNVTGCSITKNGAPWQSGLGASNPAGGLSTGALSSSTTFAISCPSSTSGPAFTGTAIVNMLPVYQEI